MRRLIEMITRGKSKKSAPARASRRRRPRAKPLLKRSSVRFGAMALAVGVIVVGAWQVWQAGWVQQGAERAKWRLIAASAALGFTVQDIYVEGRHETSVNDLRDALQLKRGTPILGFDLAAAYERVRALPWVRLATIERQLPDTVTLRIVERRPLVLWQRDGEFSLIDTHGGIIPVTDVGRFGKLVVVVGAGAPEHAARLMDLLAGEPALAQRVRAAVWVGGRRWDFHIEGGIRVRMPEEDSAEAWRRLAELERAEGLIARNFSVIDLRLKDRVIVREAPAGDETGEPVERNT